MPRVVIVVGAGCRAFLLPLALAGFPFGFPLLWLRTFFFLSKYIVDHASTVELP